MSPIRGTAVAVLTIAALLLDAGAAAAIADTPGGVAAPASPQAGGTQYGMPAGVARPQLSYLSLPSSSTAGRPPRIVLELVEPHVATVHLRVLVIDLHTRHTVLTAEMGWVHSQAVRGSGRAPTVSPSPPTTAATATSCATRASRARRR